MFRQTLTKVPSRDLRLYPSSSRAFSTSLRAMAAGDTGSPNKLGSLGANDAFQKREKANEDFAIRQREKQKLLELRQKLREQQEHLQRLTDHIDELTKEQGGEHN
ncbi:mitochondrial ATPase inhibitor, IATP-domain-containing protein [Annulohypoxylon truncatum]|uniref:mitochondrial ATPase inhibitor, IATP-domain-containing protein n=1 Tax=Annulohypoxylon truncatum TaxID=327061 RepID=UPI0020086916|nr:mitochondrial ATPase inhibitor, IATP-domain-containing protein [Annulohypoxylon truncatum]KAI1208721.1 mitochondrial ATPase inhibitor, IATP-domain-containing protein [Annulohypoxylon truncatum]